MAPEYGATMGFFPVDEATVDYLRATGRTDEEIDAFEAYFRAQGMFGIPRAGEIDYSQDGRARPRPRSCQPSPGPKRPQDRIELGKLKSRSRRSSASRRENGFSRSRRARAALPRDADHRPRRDQRRQPAVAQRRSRATWSRWSTTVPRRPRRRRSAAADIGYGDVLIAAITSCTNTSNPSVLLAAGPAREEGGRERPHGQAARQDVARAGLARGHRLPDARPACCPYLEQLGFDVAAYGCTTCIGNAGDRSLRRSTTRSSQNDLVCAAVLSGNRNFEARIHPNLKANFLASPPLVVAYAIAGTRADMDLTTEPLGTGQGRRRCTCATSGRRRTRSPRCMQYATRSGDVPPALRRSRQRQSAVERHPERRRARCTTGRSRPTSPSRRSSTASRMAARRRSRDIRGARALGIFGDSVTTDHIRPAGSIKPTSPAGHVPAGEGRVALPNFNSYGARRGNHEVMMRGTFANVRIKNLMLPPRETARASKAASRSSSPSGEQMAIYDAAMRYIARRRAARSCSAARNTAPAARATGPPRARSCSA